MNDYYILRRANGDALKIDVNGKEYIPVWDGEVAVRRSKRANPDLIVYVPVRLNRQLIERALPTLNSPLFLIDSRDLDLQTGRELSRDELVEETDLVQAA